MRNLILRGAISKLSLLALFTLFAVQSKAQDVAGLTGVVTDPTGAVVPGALVTLSNTLTGATFSAKTDNSGSYRFANVPASTGYRETFSHDGFSAVVISNLTLEVAIARTQNATLSPGRPSRVDQRATVYARNRSIPFCVPTQMLPS